MRNRWNRVLSFLCVMVMVFTMIPAGADPASVYSDWLGVDGSLEDSVTESGEKIYTFGEEKSVRLSALMKKLHLSTGSLWAIRLSVSDPTAVTLREEPGLLSDDWMITAERYFDQVTLEISAFWTTRRIQLRNPKPMIPAGETVQNENGVFAAFTPVPEGTELTVAAYEPTEELRALVQERAGDEALLAWMDISLMADGEKVESAAAITLETNIVLPEAPVINGTTRQTTLQEARLFHILPDGTAEELSVEVDTEDNEIVRLTFTTESFSTFALAYTVDFEYETDGETYEYSLPGGGFITLKNLITILGMLPDEQGDVDQFVADIQNVEFSDPTLVWVGKADEDSTVSQVKDTYGLMCEYSAEMSAKQIEEINSATISAGEWILISLKPFLSEETLTVTMKNGDIWTVKVTDAQIVARVITADGEDYIITVTYGPEAQIPTGSRLKVEEILPGTEKYDFYNEQAYNKLNPDVESQKQFNSLSNDADSYEAQIVSLPEETETGFARYFDISIIYNGIEIEPKAAVEVKIEYAEPIELMEGEELQIIHFTEDGIEVLSPDFNGNEIIFEQKSFSVTATVTTNISNGNGYALLVQHEGKYYEVMFDGSLQEVVAAGTNRYTVSMAEQWTYSNNRVYVTTNNGIEYMDPATDRGISTTNRTLSRNANGSGYTIYNGTSYLGITTDSESGQLKLSGNNYRANAGTFFFATLARTTTGRTVDHIDIGVEAKANVTVPLAYGTYYYADGSVAETVALGEFKNAQGVNYTIPINESDLMSATISSYTLNNGTRVVDNSFIISEYTSSTQQGEIDQVRIGGTFPVGWVVLNGDGRRGDIERYITRQNQVYYEVGVTKPVELTLQKERNGNLVDLYQRDSSGNLVQLKVTVDVTLTSSFSFWDNDNECPGIQYTYGYNRWGTGQNASGSLSPAGMDFRLGTTDDTDASVAAVEIIKYTVNTDGQLISVKSGGNFSFDIYQDADGDVTAPTAWSGETTANIDYSGYTKISSKSITAGEAGYGVSYDYSVDKGLVYIQETGSLEGTSIIDTDNNTWDYVETYILTEYVWRDDGGTTHSNVNQDNSVKTLFTSAAGPPTKETHSKQASERRKL